MQINQVLYIFLIHSSYDLSHAPKHLGKEWPAGEIRTK